MLVLFGATGMVGAEVLHLALADTRVPRIVSIGRRSTGITHPKLVEVLHSDFLDLAPVKTHLAGADAVIHCLGVYQNQVAKNEFWRVTYGYVDALITTLEEVRPGIRFVLMGAQGADPTERSPMLFAKAKGRAERRLTTSRLADHYITRPGYIDPGRVATRASAPTWLVRPLYRLFPSLGVDAADLARVLLDLAINGSGLRMFSNGDLRRHAASLREPARDLTRPSPPT